MTTIDIDRKTLDKCIGRRLPDRKLEDRILMLGMEVDSLTRDGLVVDVTPNRPDLLSEEGLARALSSFLGLKTGLRKYKIRRSGSYTKVEKTLKIWPYVVTAIVKGLDFDDKKIRTLIQVQEKLGMTMCRRRTKGGIGIYPLDRIKLPIKFTTMNADRIKFRPLEYPREITGRQILSKHPTGRKYGHIIENEKEFPVFIDANGTIMSMPPIINSHEVGKITEKTRNVFVEATGTSLRTLVQVINILAATMADMGGKVYSMDIRYPNQKITTPDLRPQRTRLKLEYVNKLLGLRLREGGLKKLLARMGHGYEKGTVFTPAYRTDILHPIDLVEDVAIAYGYENFEPEIPQISAIGEEARTTVLTRKVAEAMVGLGFFECMSYYLSNRKKLVEKMRLKDSKLVSTTNAVNIEYDTLRDTLLPGLMNVLADNKHHEYPQKLFEAGRIVVPDRKTETGTSEKTHLAAVIADNKAEYSDVRSALDAFLRAIGVKAGYKSSKHPSFAEGRAAEVKVSGKTVGVVGEIHPEVLENWGLEVPAAGFELDLAALPFFKKYP